MASDVSGSLVVSSSKELNADLFSRRVADWKNPGPFAQLAAPDGTIVGGAWGRFLAFWTVLVNAGEHAFLRS